jgi:regulator of replication initiation timing
MGFHLDFKSQILESRISNKDGLLEIPGLENSDWRFSMRVPALTLAAILAIGSLQASAQAQTESSLQDDIAALQKQISEMRAVMEEMKAEIVRTRTEAQELRQALQNSRGQAEASLSEGVATPGTEPIQKLQEDQELLNAKIDEQYQTKVESASKYRVRLTGTVLVNFFKNRGSVDNIDFPSLAVDSGPIYGSGSLGATLRQSLLGLEVFGPEVKGAKVNADLQIDFAGGFPSVPDGVALGLPRLRTGTVSMSWPKTTVIAGQDAPFFSPLSPSSIASVALPAFSYSGNLWTWIPQIRLERRIDLTENSNILLQGGFLDPLDGEVPPYQYVRVPQAGEASRRPASAVRTAWTHKMFGHDLTIGASSFYSRQNWGFGRHIDGWAATSDWTVPLGSRFEFDGEFYRGRAIGGLGGGIGRSVVFNSLPADPRARIRGLNTTGGWAQIKFRQSGKLEWNAAYGEDTVPVRTLRFYPFFQQTYVGASITRNQSALANFIYRPRSDVMLSLEYRRIRTLSLLTNFDNADQINLSMGVLF